MQKILQIQKRTLINWVIATGLGVVGTIQYHAAQFGSRFDTFFGDRGDARGFVYFCEHWYQALRFKTHLFSPGIFYPTKGTLAYSDLLVGYVVPYSLLRAVGLDMFSAVQVVTILLTFATYVVCFILLYKVLRFDLLPSCAGAMFFAFNSPKFFQTGHLQLQFILFLPVILILIISFYRRAARATQFTASAYLSAAGLCLMLQLITAFYYAWFFVVWAVLFVALALILRSSRAYFLALIRKFWIAILAAGAIFAIGFIPFLLVYRRTLRVGTWYSYQNVSEMIPEWWSFLSMGDGNYLWGWLSAAIRPVPWPATWGELMIGVGLIASLAWLCLTVGSLWLVKTDLLTTPEKRDVLLSGESQSASRAFLAAMILATSLFLLIGSKYWQGQSPWYYVYQYFPGAGAIRAMSRYVIVLTLPMSIGLAYAAHLALRWASRQTIYRRRIFLSVAITLVMAFGVFEQFGVFKVGGTGFSKRAEKAYLQAMAAKLPPDCEAFYVTPGPQGKHNPFEYHYDAMLISVLSGVPTINASSSQFPPHWHTMYDVKAPDYETHVQSWITLHNLRGKICRLEIGPQIEAFDVRARSPLDDPLFFVTQQYRDFAGREPSAEEAKPYVEKLQRCKESGPCDSGPVSFELFRATGFLEDGSFIYRLYQTGLARPPRYDEFMSDLAAIRGAPNRAAFVESFVNRDEFGRRYSALPDPDYLAQIAQQAEGSLPEATRQSVTGKTRAEALLATAEALEVTRKFANRAFVTLHYFGYLRRDPESGGYDVWLRLLDSTGDNALVTSRFVTSLEYRQRFFN